MTEGQLQDAIVDTAHRLGWTAAHFFPSQVKPGVYVTAAKYDGKGFPDLVLVNPRQHRVIYVECKQAGKKLEPEQIEWKTRLTNAGETVYVWRPDDYQHGAVEAVLKGAA